MTSPAREVKPRKEEEYLWLQKARQVLDGNNRAKITYHGQHFTSAVSHRKLNPSIPPSKFSGSGPEDYGEHKGVVMFGGLHIEMTALKTLEDWLYGNGWVQALVQAEITTPRMATLPARSPCHLHKVSSPSHCGCTLYPAAPCL